MARASDIIKGLTILAKYVDKGIDAHIGGADHDIIFGTMDNHDENENPISAEDTKSLESAGWHKDGEYGGWSCFV